MFRGRTLFLQALTHQNAFGKKDFPPAEILILLFGRCSFQTLVAPKQSVTWITAFKMHTVTFLSVHSFILVPFVLPGANCNDVQTDQM